MLMARTVLSDLGDVHSFKHQLKNIYQVPNIFHIIFWVLQQ